MRKLVVGAAIAVITFTLSAGTAFAYPDFPGTEPTPYPSPGGCKEVLVLGDSIAAGIGTYLEVQLEKAPYGYCSTVINRGQPGSSTCFWRNHGRWEYYLDTYPDAIVVAHFLPNQLNECPEATDPTFFSINKANVEWMQDEAEARGMSPYWVIPAPSYKATTTACYPPSQSYVSNLWKVWANSLKSWMPADHQVNLRPVFGSPNDDTYQRWFHFSIGADGQVRTEIGPDPPGFPDCVHFTGLGYKFAGDAVRAEIATEWP